MSIAAVSVRRLIRQQIDLMKAAVRLLLLLICLMLTAPSAYANENCPLNDQPVLRGWLIDSEPGHTPEHIADRPSNAWKQPYEPIPGFSSDDLWLKLDLHNPNSQNCRYWLTLGSPRLESIRLYLLNTNHWSATRAGSNHPITEWPFPARWPRFMIDLKPGQNILALVRVNSQSRLLVTPQLWNLQTLQAAEQSEQLLNGLSAGATVLILPFAFILAWAYRNALIFSNATVLLSYFMLTLVANGYLFYLPEWLPHSRTLVACLSIGTAVTYSIYVYLLFNTHKLPAWPRSLIITYMLTGIVLLGTALMESTPQTRQAFDTYRLTTYFGYPLLLILTLRYGIRLGWLAWGLTFCITLQGLSLSFAGSFYQPLAYGEDTLAVPSNLLLIVLLISTLIATTQHHRRHELRLRKEVSLLQQRAQERLEHMVELRTRQLQETLDANRKLVARISHDLRAPLGHIITHARQLAAAPVTNEAARIEHYAKHQLDMLKDLMALTLNDTVHSECCLEAGYLYAFLDNISHEGELLAARHRNSFKMQITTNVPALVTADFRKLRRVIVNLIDNATRFTQEGEVQVLIEVKQNDEDEALFKFSVTDNGPGLSQEQAQEMLRPLSKGAQSKTGYGLGLAIVSELLTLMGSRLEITQPPAGGSCFSFSLTLHLADEEQVEHVFIEEFLPASMATFCRVLLVDDSCRVLDDLSELLGGYGLDVYSVTSCNRALELLQAQDIDLVMTNQAMPDMSGWELLATLRERSPSLPVILYSALPAIPPETFHAREFDAVLLKPATSRHILTTIQELHQRYNATDQQITTPVRVCNAGTVSPPV